MTDKILGLDPIQWILVVGVVTLVVTIYRVVFRNKQ